MKKHTIKLMLFLALFGGVATSCTKEELTESPCVAAISQSAAYVVDGRLCYANPQTEEEWAAFLDRMFALVEEGHTVQFWRNGLRQQYAAAKEVITFTTTDREKAKKWAAEKAAAGYSVTVSFDQQSGIYTCIAYR